MPSETRGSFFWCAVELRNEPPKRDLRFCCYYVRPCYYYKFLNIRSVWWWSTRVALKVSYRGSESFSRVKKKKNNFVSDVWGYDVSPRECFLNALEFVCVCDHRHLVNDGLFKWRRKEARQMKKEVARFSWAFVFFASFYSRFAAPPDAWTHCCGGWISNFYTLDFARSGVTCRQSVREAQPSGEQRRITELLELARQSVLFVVLSAFSRRFQTVESRYADAAD